MAFFVFLFLTFGVWANPHLVVKGDTIYSIARSYNTTPAEIYKWNPSFKENSIKPGDKIQIPGVSKSTTILKPSPPKSLVQLEVSSTKKEKIALPLSKKSKIVKSFRPNPIYPFKGIEWESTQDDGRVFSVKSGKVVKVGELPGYKKYVILDHGWDQFSVYANLERPDVKEGQSVEAKQVLGKLSPWKGLYFQFQEKDRPQDPSVLLSSSLL
jgi:murein DD-endopeptidase MepM/ murein hydrolase activator NlpD